MKKINKTPRASNRSGNLKGSRVSEPLVAKEMELKGISKQQKLHLEKESARLKRNALGRYTLREIARTICGGENAESEHFLPKLGLVPQNRKLDNAESELLLSKLGRAAHNRTLPVYLPGQKLCYAYEECGGQEGGASIVRYEFEEAYWDDVNNWLDKEHPKIAKRLPPPAVPGDSGNHSIPIKGVPHKKNGKWSIADLQGLIHAKDQGISDEKLADLHGVTRSRISLLVKQAREKFLTSSKSANSDPSLFGQLRTFNRK